MIYSCWQAEQGHLRHVGMAPAKRAPDPAMLSSRSQLWAMELTGGQGRRGHNRRKRRPVMTWAVITWALDATAANRKGRRWLFQRTGRLAPWWRRLAGGHPCHASQADGNRPRAMTAAETRKRRKTQGEHLLGASAGWMRQMLQRMQDVKCARTWPPQRPKDRVNQGSERK